MKPEEFKESVRPILDAMFESHGKPAPSQVLAKLWFGVVRGYEVAVVVKALQRYAGRAEATYSVVQPNDIVLLIEGSEEERAGVAWLKFLSALRGKSPHLSVVFDDPVIHAVVVHMGGWVKLAQEVEEAEVDHVRRTFETTYRLFLKAGLPATTPLRLCGIIEADRVRRGLPYDAPVQLIGDPDAARSVERGAHVALPPRPASAPTPVTPTTSAALVHAG